MDTKDKILDSTWPAKILKYPWVGGFILGLSTAIIVISKAPVLGTSVVVFLLILMFVLKYSEKVKQSK